MRKAKRKKYWRITKEAEEDLIRGLLYESLIKEYVFL